MIDVEQLRKDPEPFRASMRARNMNPDLIDDFLRLDKEWRDLLLKSENLRSEQKKLGAENREAAIKLKGELKSLEEELNGKAIARLEAARAVPNLLHQDVVVGKSEQDNKVVKVWGEPTRFSFKPKDHLELGESLGLIDTKKAGEISGARFAYLKNEAVLLQFGLISFVLGVLTSEKEVRKIAKGVSPKVSSKPFTPVVVPTMIRPEIYKRMARLTESDKNERYYLPQDDLYLIGSAEHTLGPLHMDETLKEEVLPIRYIGYSTSFRREAGSYGKDTKGILRQHQFDKLEMESFCSPEDSEGEQMFLVAVQEYFLQKLKIPYRVVSICSADMGAPDFRQIDIECWIPSQNKYRETHTSDLMTDYQSRRLNTRVEKRNGEKVFAHMNDATAFAIGRILIAILENYQTEDGSIKIPKVLVPFVGAKQISTKQFTKN